MKPLLALAIASLFLLAPGCTSFGGAGVKTEAVNPTASTVAPSNANATPHTTDASANGGESLPASTPYSQPNGATAQQNINPAPFLTATSGQGPGGAETARALSTRALTSRADGTMSGPNDQPAATTGWGTAGTNWAPQNATSGTKPRKPQKK